MISPVFLPEEREGDTINAVSLDHFGRMRLRGLRMFPA